MSEPTKAHGISVTAEWSAQARAGLVNIRIGGNQVSMLPETARAVAESIITNAAYAEYEEVLVDFLTSKVGMQPEEARMALSEFRRHHEIYRTKPDVFGHMVMPASESTEK